ncbi:hypothetical protein HPB48_023165 [Haemaphysalis longicornis]|uniref:Uncharacterized protein n=1 Tax=Haemaphysalis longicornis TaxID=44386 RepID=A0A9J6H6H7_HAELO|nr:hypothetical protein HPB48_023165 [Haemaphysalis longicornis]
MAPAADYAAFLVFTGAGLGVGLYFSLKKDIRPASVTDEIFLGSNSLHVVLLGLSILASTHQPPAQSDCRHTHTRTVFTLGGLFH